MREKNFLFSRHNEVGDQVSMSESAATSITGDKKRTSSESNSNIDGCAPVEWFTAETFVRVTNAVVSHCMNKILHVDRTTCGNAEILLSVQVE